MLYLQTGVCSSLGTVGSSRVGHRNIHKGVFLFCVVGVVMLYLRSHGPLMAVYAGSLVEAVNLQHWPGEACHPMLTLPWRTVLLKGGVSLPTWLMKRVFPMCTVSCFLYNYVWAPGKAFSCLPVPLFYVTVNSDLVRCFCHYLLLIDLASTACGVHNCAFLLSCL